MKKRTIEFEISGTLPGLNEYINASRKNKYESARMKREVENRIIHAMQSKYKGGIKLKPPVRITYLWCEPNRRRDKDNVAFAKKFVQDALVKSGALPDDGWKYIAGWVDEFAVSAECPHVGVKIAEVCE